MHFVAMIINSTTEQWLVVTTKHISQIVKTVGVGDLANTLETSGVFVLVTSHSCNLPRVQLIK